jgi:hypothetical protein
MTQRVFSKFVMIVASVLLLCAVALTTAVADQAQYIYDDLGRLTKVIDGQVNVATEVWSVGRIRSEMGG